MKKYIALFLFITTSAIAAPLTFTGDAEADFTGQDVLIINDPGGNDVGVPLSFPGGTISGWDLKDVRLYHDNLSDTLYVGLNTFGIAGDADGDGDAGNTSSHLAGAGGIDNANFGGTESFALMLDIDEDGTVDVIAGVSSFGDTSSFTVSQFSGNPFTPGFAFGAALGAHTGTLHASPSASKPDLEFTILNFSSLPTSGTDSADSFAVGAFLGSFEDGGIGEDFTPGAGAFTTTTLPPPSSAVPEPSTYAAMLLGLGLVFFIRRKRK